jgi:hypothetical protein
VHPRICENLKTDHGPLIDLMKKVREEKGVKHVYHRLGRAHDLASKSAGIHRGARPKYHVGG